MEMSIPVKLRSLLHQGREENLPGQQALCHEAQRQIAALPEQVVAPWSDSPVMQRHVHGERATENEKRNEDSEDDTKDKDGKILKLISGQTTYNAD